MTQQHPTYLLDRCGLERSHTLAVYREHGGYEALAQALRDLQPADVIDQVKASGLRGR